MSSLGIFDKETKTYQKVAGTAEAAVVDTAMSDTSTNTVQNKVIKKYVDEHTPEVADMTGATSDADGTSGAVPAPTAGQEAHILNGDGTWKSPLDNSIIAAKIQELNKAIEDATALRASLEAYGMVKLCDSEAVTDSTGLALPATEKNASIEGTLAYQLSQLNTDLHVYKEFEFTSLEPEASYHDYIRPYISGNTVFFSICIDFTATEENAYIIGTIPLEYAPKHTQQQLVAVRAQDNNAFTCSVDTNGTVNLSKSQTVGELYYIYIAGSYSIG